MPMQPMPRVLLVEDDPVSRAVLGAAVEHCGVAVDTADCLQAALSKAASARHALWLIDAHLPDGSGIELLAALRSVDAATVAIAHTASLDAEIHHRLRTAGFVDVMVKPLPAAQVSGVLRTWLPLSTYTPANAAQPDPAGKQDEPPLWDEAAALRALSGNRDHVVALRALFVAELPAVAERIAAAARRRDHTALRPELHRLHASCGFVGASRLGSAARTLETRCDDAALRGFEAAVRATLATQHESQPA
jgi:CheY-like chemotaxis protein